MSEHKCRFCGKTAEWAMQFVGDRRASFTSPGSHYRGWEITWVCEGCKEARLRRERGEDNE